MIENFQQIIIFSSLLHFKQKKGKYKQDFIEALIFKQLAGAYLQA